MGMISGRVTGREVRKNRDGTKSVTLLQVELTDPEDIQTVELMSQTGEESNPPNDSKVTVIDIGEAWKLAIASDDKIVPDVAPGEKRIYSTDILGENIKAEIRLKNDGSLAVTTPGATINITASGTLNIQCDEEFIATATTFKLNGSGDNLTMWSVLNTALQSLINTLNTHTHGSGSVPDQTFSLDIDNARADTLKTDG